MDESDNCTMIIKESNIEIYLKECVKDLGGEVRKLKFISHRGAPDRLVLLPYTHFYVELKRPGGKPGEHQQREIWRLRKAGIRTEVINSFDSVDETLARYKI